MKKQIVKEMSTTRLFIVLLFSLIAMVSQAQWTFTHNVTYSCSSGYIPVANFPKNLPHYTKEACELNRSMVLADNGKDVGFTDPCIATVTATPCVGSDINKSTTTTGIPGQANPGEVSLDFGKSIFSAHPSTSIEDWARENKQLMKSLGMSIVDGKIINSPIPLSGNADFDKFYLNLYMQFNPTMTGKDLSNKPGVIDANEVKTNSTNKQGVINPNDLKASDPSLSLKASNVPPLAPITDGQIKKIEHPYIDGMQDLTNTAVGILVPGWTGYGLKFGVNLIAEDLKAAVNVWNGDPCPSWDKIVGNALETTIKGAAEDFVEGKALYFSKYVGIKSGIKPINIYNAVKTYEWAKTAKDSFDGGYKIGTEIEKNW